MKVTLNAVDVSDWADVFGFKPSDTDLGNPIDVAKFTLDEVDSATVPLVPARGQDVAIYEDDGTTLLFSGRVSEVEWTHPDWGRGWIVKVQDHAVRSLELLVQAADYSATTDNDRNMVIAIFRSAMRGRAFGTGTVDDPIITANEPNWPGVKATAILSGLKFDGKSVKAALDLLRQNVPNVFWSIGADKIVSYGLLRTAAPAPLISSPDASYNLLSGSSFETDAISDGLGNVANDGMSDYWAPYNNGPEAMTYARINGGAQDGGWFQRVTWAVTNTSTKGVYRLSAAAGGKPCGFAPLQTYTLSFYAKGSGGAIGFTMTLAFNVFPTIVVVTNPALTANWQRYVFRLTWGATIDPNDFFITINGGATAGSLDIDAAQVEAGSTASPYLRRETAAFGYGKYKEQQITGDSRNMLKYTGAGGANATAFDEVGYAQMRGRILEAAPVTNTAAAAGIVRQLAYATLAAQRGKRIVKLTAFGPGYKAGQVVDIVNERLGRNTIPAPFPDLLQVFGRSDSGKLSVGSRGRLLIQKVVRRPVASASPAGASRAEYDIEAGDNIKDYTTSLAIIGGLGT